VTIYSQIISIEFLLGKEGPFSFTLGFGSGIYFFKGDDIDARRAGLHLGGGG